MNQETMHKAVAGAVTGFVSAFLVDLHAWGGNGAYDWGKAVTRWIGGAISGALAGLGLAGVSV